MEMEMGSGSVSNYSPSSSDSINGLIFGKKIYFDQGVGSSSKAPPPPLPPSLLKSKGKEQPPPRCQVEGCNVDLTGAKSYYCRHKVCGMHSKSPMVVVSGIQQRFCQQCSRFHQLHEFDQGKRSCRRRLAGHNERRRKPPPHPFSPIYGRLSPSFYDDSSRYRRFLMDFNYQRPSVGAHDRVAGANQLQGSFINGSYNYPPTYYTSELLTSGGFGGVSDSDSDCALSLLSTQPWGTCTVPASRVTNIPMTVSSTCMAHPWGGFKSNGSSGTNRGIEHDYMRLEHIDDVEDNGRFSGGLELALQGRGRCPYHDSARAYEDSGNGMQWSL